MKLKKVLFMLNKFRTDLKRRNWSYTITDDLHSQILGEYYFLFEEQRIASGKDQNLIKKFDENGIPLNRTYIDVSENRYIYFPISIGQMGLAIYHTYLKSNMKKDRERFINFVRWFYNNADINDKLGARWLTNVQLPQYQNPGPWQSAFSQSRGISILLRGYQLSEEKSYAKMAEQALKSFQYSSSEGGVTSFTKWGPFYEEYISSVPTMVLNGKIFALFGIYDFVRVFPENKTAKKLFNDGIHTLEKILSEYNLGFWSRYNLCKAPWHPEVDPATIGYQRLHITQLKILYQLTQKEIFNEYAKLFRQQETYLNMVRMYIQKYKSLKKIGRL